MKYLKIYTIYFISICILSGCNYTKKESDKINSYKYDIGLSLATLNEDRWLKDRDIFVSEAKLLGVDVDVQNANNNSNDQYEQVFEMIENGIKVLVIVPNDADKSSEIVELARKNNVKVVCYDRIIRNVDVDLYISFDHKEVGRLLAGYLVNKVPKGNYVIINGPKNDNNSIFIKQGYDEVLKDKINKGSIKIISENFVDNWSPDEASEIMRNLLEKGEKINAIIAGNDKLAGGAINVLSEKSLAGSIPVVGEDADLAACQRIVNGTQNLTIYKPIDKLAKNAANMAVNILKGEKLITEKEINNGKYNIPFYEVDIVSIKKDNLYRIIVKEEAFHRIEDVYIDIDKSKWPQN
ncbi:MAG: substrate-binding domain-containing protein [Clostridiales bacterium]